MLAYAAALLLYVAAEERGGGMAVFGIFARWTDIESKLEFGKDGFEDIQSCFERGQDLKHVFPFEVPAKKLFEVKGVELFPLLF